MAYKSVGYLGVQWYLKPIDRQIDGRVVGWVDGWVDERVCGWKDGWRKGGIMGCY